MFGWLKHESSLTDQQRVWVDQRFQWLLDNFGDAPLRSPIITPTEQDFPEPYAATVNDATVHFDRVCSYMSIERSRIDLNFYQIAEADDVARGFDVSLQRGYALGVFQESQEAIKIWVEQTRLDEPAAVVATMAHELGHVHLLADRRCDSNVSDHEQLTDLLTVFFGFGIFTANTVLREANWKSGRFSGWTMSQRGYLSMEELAYALAVYADVRGESKPSWSRHLRKDVRSLVTTELTQLQRSPGRTPTSGLDRLINRNQQAIEGGPSAIVASPTLEAESDEPCRSPDVDSDDQDIGSGIPNRAPGGKRAADELFSVGVHYVNERDYRSAIEAFTDSLAIIPDDAEVLTHRGKAYLALRQYSESAKDCSAALQLAPNEQDTLRCRAEANLWLKQYAEVLIDTKHAIRRDKHAPLMHYFRGLAQLALGDLRSAKSDLNQAIQSTPALAELYLARSRLYQALREEKRAQADLAEACYRDPDYSDVALREASLPFQISMAIK